MDRRSADSSTYGLSDARTMKILVRDPDPNCLRLPPTITPMWEGREGVPTPNLARETADIVITAKDGQLTIAHKVILASGLAKDGAVNILGASFDLNLGDVGVEGVRAALLYLYHSQVDLDVDLWPEFLKAGNDLGLKCFQNPFKGQIYTASDLSQGLFRDQGIQCKPVNRTSDTQTGFGSREVECQTEKVQMKTVSSTSVQTIMPNHSPVFDRLFDQKKIQIDWSGSLKDLQFEPPSPEIKAAFKTIKKEIQNQKVPVVPGVKDEPCEERLRDVSDPLARMEPSPKKKKKMEQNPNLNKLPSKNTPKKLKVNDFILKKPKSRKVELQEKVREQKKKKKAKKDTPEGLQGSPKWDKAMTSTSKPVKKRKYKKKKESVGMKKIPQNEKWDKNKDWRCEECGLSEVRVDKASDFVDDWVSCDLCENWYHFKCVGLDKVPGDANVKDWFCDKCTSK